MLSELQQRKLRRLFQITDYDQDGHIQRSDYEQSVNSFAQFKGWTPDSPDYQTYYTAYLNQWEDLRQQADTDGDGCVTFEEFLAQHDRMLNDEDYFNRIIGNVAHSFLTTMDGDGDGKINKAEFMAQHAAFQVDAAASEAMFQTIDTDRDGAVGHDEMVDAVRRYYLSSDPDEPANGLMGPY